MHFGLVSIHLGLGAKRKATQRNMFGNDYLQQHTNVGLAMVLDYPARRKGSQIFFYDPKGVSKAPPIQYPWELVLERLLTAA